MTASTITPLSVQRKDTGRKGDSCMGNQWEAQWPCCFTRKTLPSGMVPFLSLQCISEKVKPHPVVINLLTRVEEIIPKWKIVPTKDVIDAAFKDPIKREEVRNNKLTYQDKPRLKTALEMLRTSMNLEDTLHEITMPFLVLHGEADTVTDPEISKALYEKASSIDKTIKLYPGMWHALTSGEPDHNVDLVFADIVSWLDLRTGDAASLTVTPIRHDFNFSAKKATDGEKRPKRSQGSLLCGLNGGRLLHRSAM
ncbi:PREDICTED: caffeoylshikimate esterase-like [Tarenaya hassleriana]|uniref:caffeoylshikimate esterase-like n=1 Tax=Tarenaya hassleriana TaxID=28532 RepID=UPI0008FD6369|nr:PREDICTED: caffeoylshikimate esterase-like [Tarenaya hassleriana]